MNIIICVCPCVRVCVCVFSSLAKASSAGDEEEAMDITPGSSNEFAIAFYVLYVDIGFIYRTPSNVCGVNIQIWQTL